MGSLIVVTGPPGAGKSATAVAVAERFDRSVLVDGDAFFAFLASGAISPWLPESNHQNQVVTDAAAAATAAFVRGGYDTVYDGVMGPWFLPRFLAGLGLPELDYVVLLPSVGECVRRVAARIGHGFTDEAATRSMHEQFLDHRPVDRHVIADDDASLDDVVAEIAERRARGELQATIRSVQSQLS